MVRKFLVCVSQGMMVMLTQKEIQEEEMGLGEDDECLSDMLSVMPVGRPGRAV